MGFLYIILSIIMFYFVSFIQFLTIGWWKRLIVCRTKGHDWYFIGGGFVLSSPKSFQCKQCKKMTDHIDQDTAKLKI